MTTTTFSLRVHRCWVNFVKADWGRFEPKRKWRYHPRFPFFLWRSEKSRKI